MKIPMYKLKYIRKKVTFFINNTKSEKIYKNMLMLENKYQL